MPYVMLASLTLTLACSNLPAVEPPAPVVARAPDAVAGLAVYVFQMAQPATSPQDDWDYHHMPGYTGELRRLFQTQLQQAGFTVLLDRTTEADLVATVQSDMPYEQAGVATLVLSRRGEIVDRISVPVRVSGEPSRTVHHAGEAAVRLVEAMSKSSPLAAVAREVASRRSERASQPELTVARVAGCPPPEGPIPEEPRPPIVECAIARLVRCQAASPVLSAWQAPPITACPREIPPAGPDVLRLPGRFSALETRNLRLAGTCGATPGDGDCCYVQFTSQACD